MTLPGAAVLMDFLAVGKESYGFVYKQPVEQSNEKEGAKEQFP